MAKRAVDLSIGELSSLGAEAAWNSVAQTGPSREQSEVIRSHQNQSPEGWDASIGKRTHSQLRPYDAAERRGSVVQVLGSTIDVKFPGEPPLVKNALKIEVGGLSLILEVTMQLSDSTVRCKLLSMAEFVHPGLEVSDINQSVEDLVSSGSVVPTL